MRIIGHLETENHARVFSDFLYAQGIDNQIETDASRSWTIWVHDDEHLAQAGELLARFRENPADPSYANAPKDAEKKRQQSQQNLSEYQKRFHDRAQLFRSFSTYGIGPLTLILVLICSGVFLASSFSTDFGPIRDLFITGQGMFFTKRGLFVTEAIIRCSPSDRLAGLTEIFHGQAWRLFTPMFIHFGLMHIFFNMMWLLDLGSMVEGRQSTRRLGVLVLAIAGISNVAQYAVSGPAFGGMSGVVYGLLGYIWIRGRLDPGCGLFLHSSTVTMMLIWFFICLLGWIPHIANTVHAAGLGVGMAWGYLSSLRR